MLIDEENISAEHALAEEDAWVPRENEDARRSPSDPEASCERSQEADGIINAQGRLNERPIFAFADGEIDVRAE